MFRLIRTVPADAAAIVRAYPPMVVCFGAALAGIALVFDIFYLVASPGLVLALVYTVPVLAGLLAGLVAAAEDVGMDRRVMFRTAGAAIALGVTNAVVVALISAIRRTGPGDWGTGWQAVLFAACTPVAVAVAFVAVRAMIWSLGLDLKTRWPARLPARPALAARVVPVPEPRPSKESVARAQVRPEPEPPAPEPVAEPPVLAPGRPKLVDLDEARPVSPADAGAHADRRVIGARRAYASSTTRRSTRPGRRPGT